MQLDDELCLCFHVSKRKVINFIRIHNLRAASQLSECFGAGTGCGWCCKYLRALFEQERHGKEFANEPSSAEYAAGRSRYVRDGKGTPPPGATPIE